jgi:hypothetical protein
VLGDLDELQAHDRFRFVNRLQGWIAVQDGRIVDGGQRADLLSLPYSVNDAVNVLPCSTRAYLNGRLS